MATALPEWLWGPREWLRCLGRVALRIEGARGEDLPGIVEEIDGHIEACEKRIVGLMDDRERIKFYLARRIWPLRKKVTPSGLASDTSELMTWAQWFEQMHGEPLADYAKRAAEQNIRKRVLEYELAKFGRSPLEDDERAA